MAIDERRHNPSIEQPWPTPIFFLWLPVTNGGGSLPKTFDLKAFWMLCTTAKTNISGHVVLKIFRLCHLPLITIKLNYAYKLLFNMVYTLDLNFLGYPQSIAAYLVETSEGPLLIETGPYSTFEVLKNEIKRCGFKLDEIKHVFLSHIHLDHAGAAWALAEQGANIYLHPFGETHLAHPEKLMESAKRIYQEDMDRLWGQMHPIPMDQLRSTVHLEEIIIGNLCLQALHTPGHAKHHIAWKMDDLIFSGDVAGVKIQKGPVVPPCPPPDINLEDWIHSIDLILACEPSQIYLTHFGVIKNVPAHMHALKSMIHDWSQWVKKNWMAGFTADELTPKFSEYTSQQLLRLGVDPLGIKQYEAANPSWMSVAGLIRYWEKKTG
jgi:glyoxylase-like metal-dependent hydrolase (beta-lactamase superfamily II)